MLEHHDMGAGCTFVSRPYSCQRRMQLQGWALQHRCHSWDGALESPKHGWKPMAECAEHTEQRFDVAD
jgi:hypothetical protein